MGHWNLKPQNYSISTILHHPDHFLATREMIPVKTSDTYYIIPERSKTETGSEGPGLALPDGPHTIFCWRGGFVYVTIAVSFQDV
jgi:hypothetical protein